MVPITTLARNKQKHQIPSLINFDESPLEHSNTVTLQNPAQVRCDQSETRIQEEVCQDSSLKSPKKTNFTNAIDHDELLNMAVDNTVDAINLNVNPSTVDTLDTNIRGVNSNEPNGPAITVSQFLQSDELLPSLNPERSIVLYSGTKIDIETPLLAQRIRRPGPYNVPTQRIRRPGPYNVSPYMTTFRSESGSSSKQPIIFHEKHPFDSISGTHDTYLHMYFRNWLSDDLLMRHQNKRNNEDRYKKKKAILPVPINFGVVNVFDKNWFYKLANEGQPINDSHIDVILYYIRKKAKYSENTTYRFSTVDCLFSSLIHNIWEAYVNPCKGVFKESSEATIREYINGFRMHVAVPWHMVENIFIPVNLKEKIHWILLVVSFENRSIIIYDSLRSIMRDTYVADEVKKYAQLIPMYLAMSDFYRKKGLDLASHPKYKDHPEYSLFDIVYVNNIPQQVEDSLDSGVYLAAYAEYLSNGNGIPEAPFDSKLIRTRYAALLWDYGMRKIQADAISDSEAPEKPIRMSTNEESIERIEIQ